MHFSVPIIYVLVFGNACLLVSATEDVDNGADKDVVCTEQYENECDSHISSVNDYDPDRHEDFCKQVRPSLVCLKNIADLCFEDEGKEYGDTREDILAGYQVIISLCGSEEGEVEGLGCLGSKEYLQTETQLCAETMFPTVLKDLFDPTLSEDDKICIAFDHIGRCLIKKMADKCGWLLGQMFDSGFRDVIRESGRLNIDSPKCQELFGERAEEGAEGGEGEGGEVGEGGEENNKRKKRSLRLRMPLFDTFRL